MASSTSGAPPARPVGVLSLSSTVPAAQIEQILLASAEASAAASVAAPRVGTARRKRTQKAIPQNYQAVTVNGIRSRPSSAAPVRVAVPPVPTPAAAATTASPKGPRMLTAAEAAALAAEQSARALEKLIRTTLYEHYSHASRPIPGRASPTHTAVLLAASGNGKVPLRFRDGAQVRDGSATARTTALSAIAPSPSPSISTAATIDFKDVLSGQPLPPSSFTTASCAVPDGSRLPFVRHVVSGVRVDERRVLWGHYDEFALPSSWAQQLAAEAALVYDTPERRHRRAVRAERQAQKERGDAGIEDRKPITVTDPVKTNDDSHRGDDPDGITGNIDIAIHEGSDPAAAAGAGSALASAAAVAKEAERKMRDNKHRRLLLLYAEHASFQAAQKGAGGAGDVALEADDTADVIGVIEAAARAAARRAGGGSRKGSAARHRRVGSAARHIRQPSAGRKPGTAAADGSDAAGGGGSKDWSRSFQSRMGEIGKFLSGKSSDTAPAPVPSTNTATGSGGIASGKTPLSPSNLTLRQQQHWHAKHAAASGHPHHPHQPKQSKKKVVNPSLVKALTEFREHMMRQNPSHFESPAAAASEKQPKLPKSGKSGGAGSSIFSSAIAAANGEQVDSGVGTTNADEAADIKHVNEEADRYRRPRVHRASTDDGDGDGDGAEGEDGVAAAAADDENDPAKNPKLNLPYHLQGDETMYSSELLSARHALRTHPSIIAALEPWWDTYRKDQKYGVTRNEYVDVHCRLQKVLRTAGAAENWNLDVAKRAAMYDWNRDTRGKVVSLDKVGIFQSLFEVADIWTETADPREYVLFLNALFARVARRNPPAIGGYAWKGLNEIQPLASAVPAEMVAAVSGGGGTGSGPNSVVNSPKATHRRMRSNAPIVDGHNLSPTKLLLGAGASGGSGGSGVADPSAGAASGDESKGAHHRKASHHRRLPSNAPPLQPHHPGQLLYTRTRKPRAKGHKKQKSGGKHKHVMPPLSKKESSVDVDPLALPGGEESIDIGPLLRAAAATAAGKPLPKGLVLPHVAASIPFGASAAPADPSQARATAATLPPVSSAQSSSAAAAGPVATTPAGSNSEPPSTRNTNLLSPNSVHSVHPKNPLSVDIDDSNKFGAPSPLGGAEANNLPSLRSIVPESASAQTPARNQLNTVPTVPEHSPKSGASPSVEPTATATTADAANTPAPVPADAVQPSPHPAGSTAAAAAPEPKSSTDAAPARSTSSLSTSASTSAVATTATTGHSTHHKRNSSRSGHGPIAAATAAGISAVDATVLHPLPVPKPVILSVSDPAAELSAVVATSAISKLNVAMESHVVEVMQKQEHQHNHPPATTTHHAQQHALAHAHAHSQSQSQLHAVTGSDASAVVATTSSTSDNGLLLRQLVTMKHQSDEPANARPAAITLEFIKPPSLTSPTKGGTPAAASAAGDASDSEPVSGAVLSVDTNNKSPAANPFSAAGRSRSLAQTAQQRAALDALNRPLKAQAHAAATTSAAIGSGAWSERSIPAAAHHTKHLYPHHKSAVVVPADATSEKSQNPLQSGRAAPEPGMSPSTRRQSAHEPLHSPSPKKKGRDASPSASSAAVNPIKASPKPKRNYFYSSAKQMVVPNAASGSGVVDPPIGGVDPETGAVAGTGEPQAAASGAVSVESPTAAAAAGISVVPAQPYLDYVNRAHSDLPTRLHNVKLMSVARGYPVQPSNSTVLIPGAAPSTVVIPRPAPTVPAVAHKGSPHRAPNLISGVRHPLTSRRRGSAPDTGDGAGGPDGDGDIAAAATTAAALPTNMDLPSTRLNFAMRTLAAAAAAAGVPPSVALSSVSVPVPAGASVVVQQPTKAAPSPRVPAAFFLQPSPQQSQPSQAQTQPVSPRAIVDPNSLPSRRLDFVKLSQSVLVTPPAPPPAVVKPPPAKPSPPLLVAVPRLQFQSLIPTETYGDLAASSDRALLLPSKVFAVPNASPPKVPQPPQPAASNASVPAPSTPAAPSPVRSVRKSTSPLKQATPQTGRRPNPSPRRGFVSGTGTAIPLVPAPKPAPVTPAPAIVPALFPQLQKEVSL